MTSKERFTDSRPAQPVKQVLITGAARGVGEAMTRLFARKGWRVYAADRDPVVMKVFTGDESYPERIVPFIMDVTSTEHVTDLFQKISNITEALDLIIPNAGIDRYMPLSEAPVEALKEIFEVNFFGVYRVNQVFIPLLRSPGGRIILIGSESFHLTLPFMPYPLTKRMVESYGRILRQELHFSGIEVSVVRPGAIQTRFIEQLSAISYPVKQPRLQEVFRRFSAGVPTEVGKTVQPEKVAQQVYEIATTPNPKFLYRINNNPRLRVASWLPFNLLEKAVRNKLSE